MADLVRTASVTAPPPLALTLRRAWFVATEPQDLPPLFTTALHGAFGHALKALSCSERSRASCRECPRAAACAYTHLFEAQGDGRSVDGVTTDAPAALALAPERFEPGARQLRLRAGEPLALRLCLIGRRAAAHEPLVAAALSRAGDLGLGIRPPGRPGRPRLDLERLEPLDLPADPAPPRALLEWRTPVRLVADGKVASRLDADSIWRTVVRRVRTLARLYGDPPHTDPVPADTPAPFSFDAAPHRVVRIDRYSARQGRRMTWPGLVGSGVLSGPGLPDAWPWLRRAEALQLGKATSFGFGRYHLLPLALPATQPPAP
jgi:hypothetical protein